MFGDEKKREPIPKLKEGLYRNQRGKCMYCGRNLDLADMHADHKIPIDHGGSNSEKNLQMLCGPCNTRKGATTDGEFRRVYKSLGLRPAREAAGRPPSRVIPLKKFEDVTKESSARRAKRKRKDDFW